MTRPDQPGDGPNKDEVVQRYLEAVAHDTRRPAARVGAAVRAHAQIQLAQARSANLSTADQPAGASRPPPANQSRWKLSLLASMALAGLTSLLVLQFERGTGEDKEIAFGQRAPAESAGPTSSSSTTQAPPAADPSSSLPRGEPRAEPPGAAAGKSPPTPPISPEKAAQPENPPKPPERSARPAQAQTPNAAIAPSPAPFPAPSTAPSTAHSPVPFPASPQLPVNPIKPINPINPINPVNPVNPVKPALKSEALAETAPAAAAAVPSLADDAAIRPAPPPPPPPPSAALRAPVPLQKQNSVSAEVARERSTSRADGAPPNTAVTDAARDPKAALQQAARSGSTAQLDRLLAQGVPLQAVLNAPDSAGRTPLIIAVLGGHAAMVQRLLELGANPSLIDQRGMTALEHARQRGRNDLAGLIEAAR